MLPPVDSADETAQAFDKILEVNLKGVWASMTHELVQMREQGSGAIVNCSSLGTLVIERPRESAGSVRSP